MISNSDDRYAIEPRIMDVLCLLAESPGDVVTRDHLISTIWQVQFGGDESLTRAISIIRKTFKKAGDTGVVIETIPKRGYRLVRDVRSFTGSQTPAPALASTPAQVTSSEKSSVTETDSSAKMSTTLSSSDRLMDSPENSFSSETYKSKPERTSFALLKFGLPALIIAGAIVTGWWIGRSSNQLPNDFPESVVHSVNNEPTQAELVQAILFSHLDGQMSGEDAIASARPHLDIALQREPDAAETMVAKGWMYYTEGKYETAHIEFERAKTLVPDRVNAWIGMAYLAARENNRELALFNLNKAIEVDQFSFRARGKKAELFMQQGEYAGAYVELNSILAFSPDNVFANMLLEKIKLFEVYDRDGNRIITPGEISIDDEALHALLDIDGIPGLSIIEFRAHGKLEWFPETGDDGTEKPSSFGSMPLINVNFDLRNSDAPLIDIDR